MDIMDIAIAKALAGGGGGGGGLSSVVVKFSVDADTEAVTADKTFAEIETAIRSGQFVIGHVEWSDTEPDTWIELCYPQMYIGGDHILFIDVNTVTPSARGVKYNYDGSMEII